jgi:TonB family protein
MPTGLGLYSNKQYESRLFLWIGLAAVVHIAVVGLFILTVTILGFLGFKIPLFSSQMKQPDIEFVLVDNQPEQAPRKPTNLRAEKNTRSGGKKIANRPVQVSQQAAGAASKKAAARPNVAPQPKSSPAPQPRPQKRSTQQAQTPAPTPQQPKQAPSQPPAPAPKAPQPTKIASATPRLPSNPIAPTIPTPAPKNPAASTGGGRVAQTASTSPSGNPGAGSASGSPSSSFIGGSPSRGSGNPGSAGSRGGSSGGGGRGSYNQSGSPGGGGGRDGVDAMAEPDFGPYIAELQRRIRRNWAPPVEDRSKRVVALFKVSRDGRLLSLRVQQSSGSAAADQAAMAAVRASAPFKQLPPNYPGSDIDVQFIFDYEIYGHGSAQRR